MWLCAQEVCKNLARLLGTKSYEKLIFLYTSHSSLKVKVLSNTNYQSPRVKVVREPVPRTLKHYWGKVDDKAMDQWVDVTKWKDSNRKGGKTFETATNEDI